MPTTTPKLTTAIEHYLADLQRIRASGSATGERSSYGPLANLLNAIGRALKPKVFCVGELADQGAGQVPERGVVEVKSADDDAWLTAEGDQVSRYWTRYGLVPVTNTRDFVLVGEDAEGRPAKLETFRLAESAEEFQHPLEKPGVFAREVGAGLGEYLCRALSQRAALTEPRDLAWLLASYARDGLARVEAAGDAPPLKAVRSALEEALGVRFEGPRGEAFFRSTLVQTLFYGLFSAWVLWARQARQADRFDWRTSVWHLRAPVLRVLFHQLSGPGRLRRLDLVEVLDWTAAALDRVDRPASPASTRARPCPTSTSPSSKLSTPICASSSASGTPPPKWCAIWSPASTGLCATTSASPTGWQRRTSTSSTRAAAPGPIWPRCCAASPPTSKDAASAPSPARG